MEIQLKPGQIIESIDDEKFETEKGDFVLIESFDSKSDIGSGWAEIYRGSFIDSLSVFKDVDEVFVAKDLESGIELSLKGRPVVLVTNAYKNVLRAFPIVEGQLLTQGMFDGSFIYTSNDVIMKGYSHPIRLMARIE
jgi:hypothetical protein